MAAMSSSTAVTPPSAEAPAVAGSNGGTGDAANTSAADAGGTQAGSSSHPVTSCASAAPDAPGGASVTARAPLSSLPMLPMQLWDTIMHMVSSEDIIDSEAAARGVSCAHAFGVCFCLRMSICNLACSGGMRRSANRATEIWDVARATAPYRGLWFAVANLCRFRTCGHG